MWIDESVKARCAFYNFNISCQAHLSKSHVLRFSQTIIHGKKAYDNERGDYKDYEIIEVVIVLNLSFY